MRAQDPLSEDDKPVSMLYLLPTDLLVIARLLNHRRPVPRLTVPSEMDSKC